MASETEASARRGLAILLGGELYGIAIESVSEIITPAPITFVPGAPDFVLGVANVRGQILPIFSLRILLGKGAEAVDGPAAQEHATSPGRRGETKPRIVVIRHAEKSAGLLVDAVTEVYDVVGERQPIMLNSPTLFEQMEAWP